MLKIMTTLLLGMIIGVLPAFAEGTAVNTDIKGAGGKSITAFDRVGERKIGGYFDTEYHAMRDGKRTFKAHRFILQASSQVHERVLVNTEIEFEYGGKIEAGGNATDEGELKLEQAWADFSLDENHYLRAGIILIPFGIINILHDSDVRDTTQRPLYAKYIVPSTWMDTGIGAHGTFDVGEVEFNYEGYMINGLSGTPTETDGVRKSRPNFKEDNNNSAAITGRLGFSPVLGLEIGTSTYIGQYDENNNGITMIGLDTAWKKGPFELVGEWAKIDIDASSTTVPSSMSGYYIESRYHFFPSFLKESVITRGFSHPIFTLFARYGAVDLNEDVSDKGLSRVTIGINYRPTETVVFKVEGQLGRINGNSRKTESGIISSIAIGF